MKLSKLFYNVKKLDDKKIYTLLGLKFSKRRDLYKAGKDIENVFNYARINMDIEKLPAATGILRKIQLANVKILQEIDRVCNENNLKYWIDFGTLIGAVRHKGYVPWDDDIDICMMREDYDKILNIFNKNTKHPELEAVLHMHKDGTSNIIKVVHKDSPALWI
ncbi:MAG: LicD family protein, partial [Lactobacillales bacterium]|nr:LicD family protein [Lactobacillales bacterium]